MMKRLLLFTLCITAVLMLACEKKATVDDVVMMMTEATGGADKLLAVSDQTSTWDFKMVMPHQEGGIEEAEGEMGEEETAEAKMVNMPMTITYKRPGKIRFDFMEGEGGEVSMSSAYDGAVAWEMNYGHIQQKSEMETKMDAEMARTWIDGFMNYKDNGYTMELLPNEMMDERECMVLKATDVNEHTQTYYIDTDNHFIVRQAGDMLNMQKEMEPMYMAFSDYEKFDGIAGPKYVALHKQNGDLLWEATLKEITYNTGVEDDAFNAPEMTMK